MSLLDDVLRMFGTSRTRLRWRWDRFKKGREREKTAPPPPTKYRQPMATRVRRSLRGFLPEGVPIYTIAIIVSCVALYMVEQKVSVEPGDFIMKSVRDGAMLPAWVFQLHQYWRLLTANFLHGGFMHVLFNMIALAQLGWVFESRWGRQRFLLVFMVTGVAGMGLSAVWKWYTIPGLRFTMIGPMVVGASGAIFGLIGAGITSIVRRGSRGMVDARRMLITWAIWGFILGFSPGIDNTAHVGGFLAGLVMGLVISDGDSPRAWLGPKSLIALELVLLAVIVAAFVLNQQRWPLEADGIHFRPEMIPH